MEFFVQTVLHCFAFILISVGVSDSAVESPCGDWTPYENENCVTLVTRSGLQTKQDGEIICKTFSEELHGDDIPRLITIGTQEKQQFLQKLIFDDLANHDNVWLGLDLGEDGTFRWNDGKDLFFTNWINETMNENDQTCVQMESGEGAYEKGKWVRVECTKRNAVVCERRQPLTIATLQDMVLDLQLELKRNSQAWEMKLNEVKKETEEKLKEANRNITFTNQEIATLKQNPVPVGFIYVQLAGQDPPTTLWPQTSWKDVGSNYSGLFFRVEGDDAAPFGELQEDNTRSLAQAYHSPFIVPSGDPEIPLNGSWSEYALTGTYGKGALYGLRFRLTAGEVRPRNKSVKIWQRAK